MGLLPIIDQLALVRKFAEHIKWLLEGFLPKPNQPNPEPTIKQCDDAINIVKPIANNGGTQNFYVAKGDMTVNILEVTATDARSLTNKATMIKAQLKGSNVETAQRVPMIWKRLDSDDATLDGISPDKATIEEIDPRPRPVLFTDEMASLKRAMIEDEEKPFRKGLFC